MNGETVKYLFIYSYLSFYVCLPNPMYRYIQFAGQIPEGNGASRAGNKSRAATLVR